MLYNKLKEKAVICNIAMVALALMVLSLLSLQIGVRQASAADRTTVEYTCNEGIPLLVEYINTHDSSIAIISHDSSPKITLDSIPSGSGSKYFNGDWLLHVKGKVAFVGTQGRADDECRQVKQVNHTAPPSGNVKLPRKAKSWGGVVRSGPGMKFKKRASLKEGEWITLLERTNKMMNGYPWFKIKYRGRVGFKWGGILCSVGTQVEGTYQTCN